MSGNYGRRITTDGLVFYADLKNPRSYAGEPTENLVPYFESKQRTWRRNNDGTPWINFINDYEVEYDFLISEESDGDALLFYPQLPTFTGKVEEGWYTWSVEVMELGHWNLSSGQRMNIAIQDGGANQVAVLNIYNPVEGEKYHVSYYNPPENTSFARLQIYMNPSLKTGDSAKIRLRYQLEKKPYPTPFTETERLAVDGWRDLIKSNHADLTNASFNSEDMIFDDNSFVSIPNFTELNGKKGFTISTWFNPDSPHDGYLLWKNYQFLIQCRTDNTIRVRFHYDDINWGATPTAPYEADKWNHVTVTRDLEGVIRIYMNGELVTTDVSEVGIHTALSTNSTSFDIGWRTNSSNFNGRIELPMIYSKALSDSDVKSNYENFKGRFL